MEEKERRRIVNSVDIILALFIILLGGLLIIFSFLWNDYLSSHLINISWFNMITPIILFSGITVTVYGIKRMIQDLLS